MKVSNTKKAGSKNLNGHCSSRTIILTVLATASVCTLNGCSTPTPGLGEEGKRFVSDELQSMRPSWNATEVERTFIDDDKKLGSAALRMYANALGDIRSVGPITMSNMKVQVGINIPTFIGTYQTSLTCKNGEAKTTIVAQQMNGKWGIRAFNVNADALKNVGKAESKDALEFVDRFVPRLATDWRYETLKDNSTEELIKEMDKNGLATKLMFAGFSKMGHVKTYKGSKVMQVQPDTAGYAFAVRSSAEFEHANGDIYLLVKKEAGHWKINNLNIAGHP